jgi:hypothetical protein
VTESLAAPGLSTTLLGSSFTISAPSRLLTRLAADLAGFLSCESSVSAVGLSLDDAGRNLAAPEAPSGPDPLQNAVAAITGYAISCSPLLCMHAGVLAGASGLVVVPGRSGHGKSTLVAALVRAGFGYLSDEVLAVDRTSLTVAPFARPIALDANSCAVLGLPFGGETGGGAGAERLVGVDELGRFGASAPVTDIVLSARRPEARSETTVASTGRGAAVTALLAHAFNHYADPAASFRAVVALVRAARVWEAAYAEAPVLAAALAKTLAADGNAAR